MTVNMSNPAPKNFEEKDEEGNVVSSTPNEEHAVVSVTAMKDSISFFNTTYNVPNTGGWGNKEEVVVENIPMPAGLLQLKLFGEKAVGGWVGNIYNISFAKVEGTEGQGSQGISEVNVAGTIAKGIYSLGGQYMGSDLRRMPKGLYIVNGRKVIIK
jgi:hypothetical protein